MFPSGYGLTFRLFDNLLLRSIYPITEIGNEHVSRILDESDERTKFNLINTEQAELSTGLEFEWHRGQGMSVIARLRPSNPSRNNSTAVLSSRLIVEDLKAQ